MTLTLSVLRCPDHVAPEVRRLTGGELVIGRGPGADWTLADTSDRPQISRRHCIVFFSAGSWKVADHSTNGTFLNRDADPIGSGERNLRAGDRLRIGPYEIEVGMAEQQDQPAPSLGGGSIAFDPFAADPNAARIPASFERSQFGRSALDRARPEAPPFGGDPGPRSAFESTAPASPFAAEIGSGDDRGFGQAVRLPENFAGELFDPPSAPPERHAQQDHTPAFGDVMRPPQAHGLLPVDWDAPAPAAPAPFAFEAAPPPAAAPASPAPEPAIYQPAAPAPVSANAATTADDPSLLAAFLQGAGMAGATVADPRRSMHDAGAAFRAFVQGLRAVLIARAEVKSTFRIDQTMVRARGNNPLKFAAGDDDALSALLGTGRHTDMTAAAAVAESLRDIRLHELVTMVAMQKAVRDLLSRLDPAKLRAAAETGGIGIGLQRKARAWELFEAEFARLHEALSERFDDAFGQSFAQAYEQALAELRTKDDGR